MPYVIKKDDRKAYQDKILSHSKCKFWKSQRLFWQSNQQGLGK